MAITQTEKVLMKVPQVAERLNISLAQCWRLIANGTIPSVRLSERVVRIDEDELEAWLTSKKSA